MAQKTKSVWFCTSCGNESAKWMGRCPSCGEWNTMVEEKVAASGGRNRIDNAAGHSSRPVPLSEIDSAEESRKSLYSAEMDRLLGGGIVEGSLVLVAGEPGIGKSTLSLQIPLRCKGLETLYVTGEGLADIRGALEHVSKRVSRVCEMLAPDLPYYNKPAMSSRIALTDLAYEDHRKGGFFNKLLNIFGG